MPDEKNSNKEIQKAMHKLFCVCTVFAAGVLLAAADISFKWDVSGRNVAEPAGVSAAFASFDSAIVTANAGATPAATVRAAYRDDFESGETDVSTFQVGTCIIVR